MSDEKLEILNRLESIESKLDSLQQLTVAPEAESEEIIDIPASLLKVNIGDVDILTQEVGVQSAEALSSDLELRFKSWTYKWSCNVFKICYTTYSGRVFVIRKSTGQVLTWNLIESATKKDHGLPFWSTSPNYNYERNSPEVYFGFGRQSGRSRHVSSCINCRANWGSISFRWDATA